MATSNSKRFEYDATLTNDKVLAALHEIRDEVKNVAKTAEGKFKQAGGEVNGLTSVLKTSNLAVVALGAAFISAASKAVNALADISKEAVGLNAEMEQNRIVFENMFGDQELAEGFLANMRAESAKLGVSFQDTARFAKAILPDTRGMEEFNEMLRLAAVGSKDTGLALDELIFSFNEAVSGDFVSMRDRLDLPKESVQRIKDTTAELGQVGAIIEELNRVFTKRGINDLETFSDSYGTQMSMMKASVAELKLALGEPIFEEMKEQVTSINATIEENREEFTLIAKALGQVVTAVVNFIGTNLDRFLSSINSESVLELLDALHMLIENGKIVIEVLFGLQGNMGTTMDVVDAVTVIINKLNDAVRTLSQVLAIGKAADEAFTAAKTNVIKALSQQLGLTEALGIAQDEVEYKDPAEEFKRSLLESAQAMEEADARLKAQQEQMEEYEAALNDTTEKNLDFSDSLMMQQQAAADAEKALMEYEAALQEVSEAEEKLSKDRATKEEDLATKLIRKKLDAELAFARKREDLEDKHLKRVEAIHSKNQEAINKLSANMSKEQAELVRQKAADMKKADMDLANERKRITRDYHDDIKQIEADFERDREEAARGRDAIAILRLARQADRQVEEAKENRDRELRDATDGSSERKAELEQEHAEELSLLNQANAEKMAALQAQLQAELQANEAKRVEEQAKLSKAEQRKAEDRELWLQRQYEDMETWEQRKTEAMKEKFADQLALVESHEKSKNEIAAQYAEKRIKAHKAEMATISGDYIRLMDRPSTGTTQSRRSSGSPLTNLTGPMRSFAKGGKAPANELIKVGEKGPELLILPRPGTIVPNGSPLETMAEAMGNIPTDYSTAASAVAPPQTMPAPITNNSASVRNDYMENSINLGMLTPGDLTGEQIEQIKELFFGLFAQIRGKSR
ncbi:MAG: hypothetical protein OEX12_01200 [Gammaproteobacteria bacterium]|nr:hypothetical protein [Gammaproteobacteria bacterium]